MHIATVVEGPSDYEVVITIINRLLPGRHRYSPLQPIGAVNEIGEVVYGDTGTGWKGVRRWCRETWLRSGSSLEAILESVTNAPYDLLIIQVDADIAREHDLQDGIAHPIVQVQLPCPPVQSTTLNLRQVILNWLNRQSLPPQVVIMIPSQDTETWTFAALYPDDPFCARMDYECFKKGAEHPGFLLTLPLYGKRLKFKNGSVKKNVKQYQLMLPTIGERWDRVCQICTQADLFSQEVVGAAARNAPCDQSVKLT